MKLRALLLTTVALALSAPAWAKISSDHGGVNGGAVRPGYAADTCNTTTTAGAIRYNSSTLKLEFCNGTSWVADGSSGTATPAGADQQVQFNNAGAMGANSALTFNSSNGQLMAGGLGIFSSSGTASMYLQGSGSPYSMIYLTNNNFGKYWAVEHRSDIAGAFTMQYYNGSTYSYGLFVDPNSLSLAAGLSAGQNLTTSATQNVLLGSSAGAIVSSGAYNVAVGGSSLGNATTASNSTAVGYDTLNLATGGSNTALGASVGSTTLTTGTGNILIGTSSAVTTPAAATSNFLNIGNIIFASGMTGTLTAPAGNVGIGTASPSANLEVDSAGTTALIAQAPSNSTFSTGWTPQVIIQNTDNTTNNWGQIGFADGSGVFAQLSTRIGTEFTDRINHYGDIVFVTRAADGFNNRMRILSAGYVGIGTSSPNALLDVAGEIRTTGNTLACSSTTTGAIRYNSSSKAFDYCGGTTPAWTMFGNGSVTPAGSDQQVQLNSNGVLYASSGLKFNSSSGILTVPTVNVTAITGSTSSTTGAVTVAGGLGVAQNITAGYTLFGGGLGVTSWDNTAYTSTSSSASYPPDALKIYNVNTNQLDSELGGMMLQTENTAGKTQTIYMGAVSNTGATTYTPTFVIGQQTGAAAYAERMRIASTGNIGIGTTSPAYSLQVVSSTQYGIYGATASTTDPAAGVYGIGTGSGGNGVMGEADVGEGWGVFGETGSTAGGAAGVEGQANGTSGAVYGVQGTTSSTAGYGGEFENDASTPGAAIYINGFAKLKPYSSAPVACSSTYDGAIALTAVYTTCVCKGSASAWYLTSNGTTACTW